MNAAEETHAADEHHAEETHADERHHPNEHALDDAKPFEESVMREMINTATSTAFDHHLPQLNEILGSMTTCEAQLHDYSASVKTEGDKYMDHINRIHEQMRLQMQQMASAALVAPRHMGHAA